MAELAPSELAASRHSRSAMLQRSVEVPFMRLSACICVGTLSALGLLAFSSDAGAQEPAPPPVAPAAGAGAPAAVPLDSTADDEDDKDLKHFALTLNPLSFILTRIGINFEYMLAKHHGLIVNPFFQGFSVGDDANKTSYTNFGGELGYRFYTGSRGANGFFVGPFVTFISSNASTTATVNGNSTTADSSLSIYGGGVDLGGQHVFRNGFTIGGGAGVEYLKASATAANESSTFKVEGVLPRFLFTVGYSF
jgi:hypothetical protein